MIAVTSLIELLTQILISLIIGAIIALPIVWIYFKIHKWRIKKNIPLELRKELLESKIKGMKGGSYVEKEIQETRRTGETYGDSGLTPNRTPSILKPYKSYTSTTEYTPGVSGGTTAEDIKRELGNSSVGNKSDPKRNWARS